MSGSWCVARGDMLTVVFAGVSMLLLIDNWANNSPQRECGTRYIPSIPCRYEGTCTCFPVLTWFHCQFIKLTTWFSGMNTHTHLKPSLAMAPCEVRQSPCSQNQLRLFILSAEISSECPLGTCIRRSRPLGAGSGGRIPPPVDAEDGILGSSRHVR